MTIAGAEIDNALIGAQQSNVIILAGGRVDNDTTGSIGGSLANLHEISISQTPTTSKINRSWFIYSYSNFCYSALLKPISITIEAVDVQNPSAAYSAGLRNGDRIVSIDSYDVNTLTYEAILDIVRKA
jgi:hypothetical protein